MSIRKALGAVKDQTTISLAKVTGAVSPDLDVAVVRATSHDDAPADARHTAQVLRLTSGEGGSRAHVAACVASLARRLARTRDYVVAAKGLALVHRLVAEGDPHFRHEVLRPALAGRRAGEPLLALLGDFRDEAHSASWDHSAFVRSYAAYLDARVRFLVSLLPPPRSVRFADDPMFASASSFSSPPNSSTSVHDMDPESLLTRSRQLRDLLDRVLACRPSGAARNSRVVLAALYQLLKDSFQLHADVTVVLAVLLDRFFDMEYSHCVKAFEAYVGAAKQIDGLLGFYDWCKDVGVARAADFPDVSRIDDKLLETFEQFLRERGRAVQNDQSFLPPPPQSQVAPATQQQRVDQDDREPSAAAAEYDDMNRVKALPAPAETPAAARKTADPHQSDGTDHQLVDLREPADDQGNKLALALFNAPPPPATNGEWVAFPSDSDNTSVTSAWQTPAAEPGNSDWELALIETASTLSRQKAALGGGLDPLLLGGMYDQGTVRQQVAAQAASGSASSVAFPGRRVAPVLALPAPDGTVRTVGGDPFAASLAVPPPAYVQMAEMERKQELLVQEQQMWAQYRQHGMQGQPAGLAAGGMFASNVPAHRTMPMPYGIPAMAYNQSAGYYY